MITRAEELFNIPIRKKSRGQIVTELVSQRNLKVALACRLFGHCRQAYYQSKADIEWRKWGGPFWVVFVSSLYRIRV